MNIVDDIVSNFVNEHHLWSDEYSKLLFKILGTIDKPYKAAPIQGRFGIKAGAQNLQVYLKKEELKRRSTLETSEEFKGYKTSLQS
jgi:hypothetical protein